MSEGQAGAPAPPTSLGMHGVFYTAWAVDPAYEAAWLRLLSEEEVARAGRFACMSARAAYIAAHGLARWLLGRLLQVAGRLSIEVDTAGKPCLPGSEWQFNLSHSGSWVAVALGRAVAVGIDIECGYARCEERLARFALHAGERRLLAAAPCKTSAFLACWVTKEASVKAWGTGLSTRLAGIREQAVEQAVIAGWARQVSDDHDRTAYVRRHQLPGAQLALAVADSIPATVMYLPPDDLAAYLAAAFPLISPRDCAASSR